MGDKRINRGEADVREAVSDACDKRTDSHDDHGHLPACGIDLVAGGGMSGVFFMAPGDIGHERARKGVDGGNRKRDGQHGEGETAQAERGKFVEKRITPPKHSPHGKDQQTRRNERKLFIHTLQRRGKRESAHQHADAHNEDDFHGTPFNTKALLYDEASLKRM